MVGGIIVGALVGLSLLGGTVTAIVLVSKYLLPFIKTNEYICYYKIGKIKQIAVENKIDIGEVIKEDSAMRSSFSNRNLAEAIDEKLKEELEIAKKPEKK